MNKLNVSDLRACQARGLIPGPEESERDFEERVRKNGPFKESFHAIFSFKPDWVEVVYSNKGLLPWEGGCTMIDETSLTVQTRKKVFGYDRREIIQHELVHAVRLKFEEPLFEEILAYQTSTSRFRRYFGPLFRSSKESLFTVVMLSLFSCVNLLYIAPLLTTMGTALLLSFFLIRLFRYQKIFSKALSNLRKLYKDKALTVALQLTDSEIILFSKKTPEEIVDYGKAQKCLRWQMIQL